MSTEKNLSNLIINKVESQAVYDYMKLNHLINSDELYFVADTNEVATDTDNGLMSAEDKIKLDGIASGAEVNVQSDWNETDTTSDTYILNKPIVRNATLIAISEYTADEIQTLWDSIFV